MSKKIIIANLKMHGSSAFYEDLFAQVKSAQQHLTANDVQIVMCVPYPYLFLAEKVFVRSGISWGSQNVAKELAGPFTGEVSVTMLTDFGSQYAIIGHSERSTAYCESDFNIAEKFKRLKEHNVRPVLCVGETFIEREAGMEKKVIQAQLETILSNGSEIFTDSVIAYEPIWAIGSNMAASPEYVQNMCSFIRDFIHSEGKPSDNNDQKKIPLKVVYGGSVNEKNTLQLLSLDEVDGALIGRCSLSADKFIQICNLAHQI
jgi:triosephosphate isomerase